MNKVAKQSRKLGLITQQIQSRCQRGIALLEVLIAILVFSMGLIGLVFLQGVMITGTSQAKMRTDASYVAQRRIAMMWADSTNLAAYDEVDTSFNELPNGLRTTANVLDAAGVATGAVKITIKWTMPGEPQHQYVVNARIAGAT